MRALLVLAVLAGCSNAPKREDAAPVTGSGSGAAPATAPRVVLDTPTGPVEVAVEVVDTWAKIERGLMFREHLAPDAGMLFLMGEDKIHTFWMRNTLIPLDMIFITKDLTVAGVVHEAAPRTETMRRVGAPSRYVLEVNGGWARPRQIGPGTRVRFVGVRH